MPTDRVWWVDNSAPGPGTGTEQDPFTTIAAGMAQIGGGDGTLRVRAGTGDYTNSISIGPGQTVAILGESAVLRVLGQAIFVDTGGTALFESLSIVESTTGINSSGGNVWLDRMTILDNNGIAGILVSGGSITLRNSFIGGNSNTVPGVLLSQGTATILYSTLATGVDAPAITCQSGGSGSTIRNSIVVSRMMSPSPEIVDCDSMDISSSALEMPLGQNVELMEMSTTWFTSFNSGDFHLSPAAPASLSTAATWVDLDPPTDFDGDLRPTENGTSDWAGADIPQ